MKHRVWFVLGRLALAPQDGTVSVARYDENPEKWVRVWRWLWRRVI